MGGLAAIGIVGSILSNAIAQEPLGAATWSVSIPLFVFVLLFARRQFVIDELRQQTELKFEDLIRTQPPAFFLSTFAATYDAAEELRRGIVANQNLNPPTRADVEAAIRRILQHVARLARRFDAEPPGTVYGANVMLFRPTDSIPVAERDAVRARILFCHDVDIGSLRGILDLDASLSVSSEGDPNVDPSLRAVALAIHDGGWQAHGDELRVLPGAPRAFLDSVRGFDGYADIGSLETFLRTKVVTVSKEVVQEILTYFESIKVRSFVSYAMPVGNPTAVLNIHSNKPGLLKGLGAPERHYYALVRPFFPILCELIRVRPA
jgi:hypothetical protein